MLTLRETPQKTGVFLKQANGNAVMVMPKRTQAAKVVCTVT